MYLFAPLKPFQVCLRWHARENGAGEKGKYTWCPPALKDPESAYSHSSSETPVEKSVLLKLRNAGGDQRFPTKDGIIVTGDLLQTVLVLQGGEKMLGPAEV